MQEKVLTNNTIISTIMANLGFENEWNDIGGILIRTAVGDKFIFEELSNKKAILGGEQSGHILSKINNFCGDGILTAIQICRYCKKKKISLHHWLNTSFTAYPQKLTNIYLPSKLEVSNKSFKEVINETAQIYLNDAIDPCRIFVRPSGTEPLLRILVEAKNQIQVDSLSKKITSDLKMKIDKIIKN